MRIVICLIVIVVALVIYAMATIAACMCAVVEDARDKWNS